MSGTVDLSEYVCLLLCVLFILCMFGLKHVRCGVVLLCLLVRLCVLFFILKLTLDFVLFYLEGPGFFLCSQFCPPRFLRNTFDANDI